MTDVDNNIKTVVNRLAPNGLDNETERYIRRLYNADDKDIQVDLVIELADFLKVDTDKIIRVFYDISADII